MDNQREKREVYYKLSKKILDLMLKNGYLEQEDYKNRTNCSKIKLSCTYCKKGVCLLPCQHSIWRTEKFL